MRYIMNRISLFSLILLAFVATGIQPVMAQQGKTVKLVFQYEGVSYSRTYDLEYIKPFNTPLPGAEVEGDRVFAAFTDERVTVYINGSAKPAKRRDMGSSYWGKLLHSLYFDSTAPHQFRRKVAQTWMSKIETDG